MTLWSKWGVMCVHPIDLTENDDQGKHQLRPQADTQLQPVAFSALPGVQQKLPQKVGWVVCGSMAEGLIPGADAVTSPPWGRAVLPHKPCWRPVVT